MQNKRSSIKEKWDLDNQMLYYVGQKERVMPMILGGVIGDALGVPASLCGGRDEHDNGKGALMRISPLVPLLSKTFDVDVKLNKIKKSVR